MAAKRLRKAIDVGRHPGDRGEPAHQQKQRDRRQVDIAERRRRFRAEQRQRRLEAADEAESSEACNSHRCADRHVQRDQREHADEPEQSDGQRVRHAALAPSASSATSSRAAGLR
jgi:hypothetical protein